MTPAGILWRAWDWEPSVVAGCLGLGIAYAAITRCRPRAQACYFFSGALLLLLDLVSPIDTLGDSYLFTAHVVQHFFLALLIPPLLLLGLPSSLAKSILRRQRVAEVERALAAPPVAWMLGVGTMIFWHVPATFNAALENDGLHVLQHLSFLVSGTIFWWPVLQPMKERRLAPLPALPYLFSACICCTLLGAWLAFSPLGLYPKYLLPEDVLGIVPMLRDRWGLSPRIDRELGGLLMWIPGCFVYLTAILTTVARWYGAQDEEGIPV